MAEISKELMEILANAGGVTQLVSLARENGIDVTQGKEQEFYDEVMSAKNGQPLSDDELEDVSGGGTVRRFQVDKRCY